MKLKRLKRTWFLYFHQEFLAILVRYYVITIYLSVFDFTKKKMSIARYFEKHPLELAACSCAWPQPWNNFLLRRTGSWCFSCGEIHRYFVPTEWSTNTLDDKTFASFILIHLLWYTFREKELISMTTDMDGYLGDNENNPEDDESQRHKSSRSLFRRRFCKRKTSFAEN